MANSCVGKVGTDKIDVFLLQSKVNGQAGLVLAMSRYSNKFPGKGKTALPQGVISDFLLFFPGTPAADGDNGLRPPDFLHQLLQENGGTASE